MKLLFLLALALCIQMQCNAASSIKISDFSKFQSKNVFRNYFDVNPQVPLILMAILNQHANKPLQDLALQSQSFSLVSKQKLVAPQFSQMSADRNTLNSLQKIKATPLMSNLQLDQVPTVNVSPVPLELPALLNKPVNGVNLQQMPAQSTILVQAPVTTTPNLSGPKSQMLVQQNTSFSMDPLEKHIEAAIQSVLREWNFKPQRIIKEIPMFLAALLTTMKFSSTPLNRLDSSIIQRLTTALWNAVKKINGPKKTSQESQAQSPIFLQPTESRKSVPTFVESPASRQQSIKQSPTFLPTPNVTLLHLTKIVEHSIQKPVESINQVIRFLPHLPTKLLVKPTMKLSTIKMTPNTQWRIIPTPSPLAVITQKPTFLTTPTQVIGSFRQPAPAPVSQQSMAQAVMFLAEPPIAKPPIKIAVAVTMDAEQSVAQIQTFLPPPSTIPMPTIKSLPSQEPKQSIFHKQIFLPAPNQPTKLPLAMSNLLLSKPSQTVADGFKLLPKEPLVKISVTTSKNVLGLQKSTIENSNFAVNFLRRKINALLPIKSLSVKANPHQSDNQNPTFLIAPDTAQSIKQQKPSPEQSVMQNPLFLSPPPPSPLLATTTTTATTATDITEPTTSKFQQSIVQSPLFLRTPPT